MQPEVRSPLRRRSTPLRFRLRQPVLGRALPSRLRSTGWTTPPPVSARRSWLAALPTSRDTVPDRRPASCPAPSRARPAFAQPGRPADPRPARHGWRVTIDWIVTIVGADRDRAARQGVGRQPVPDPVVVDGADAALRPPASRLRGALLRPGAREPVHLPLPRPAARRDHRLQDAAGGASCSAVPAGRS